MAKINSEFTAPAADPSVQRSLAFRGARRLSVEQARAGFFKGQALQNAYGAEFAGGRSKCSSDSPLKDNAEVNK
jgi:hypothetical protein